MPVPAEDELIGSGLDQNFIERSVFWRGPTLQVLHRKINNLVKSPTAIRTLADAERDHIRDVLERRPGWVAGTTLLYRMQKLGITTA